MRKIKAYTVIEISIVLAIIVILAAAAIPNVYKIVERNKINDLKNYYYSLKSAVDAYVNDTGDMPTTGENTNNGIITQNDPNLKTQSITVAGWKGPYITEWKKTNAWGGSFNYYMANYGYPGFWTISLQVDNVPLDVMKRLEAEIDSEDYNNMTVNAYYTGSVRSDVNNRKVYLMLLRTTVNQ